MQGVGGVNLTWGGDHRAQGTNKSANITEMQKKEEIVSNIAYKTDQEKETHRKMLIDRSIMIELFSRSAASIEEKNGSHFLAKRRERGYWLSGIGNFVNL